MLRCAGFVLPLVPWVVPGDPCGSLPSWDILWCNDSLLQCCFDFILKPSFDVSLLWVAGQQVCVAAGPPVFLQGIKGVFGEIEWFRKSTTLFSGDSLNFRITESQNRLDLNGPWCLGQLGSRLGRKAALVLLCFTCLGLLMLGAVSKSSMRRGLWVRENHCYQVN